MTLKNFLKQIFPKIATPRVIKNTQTLAASILFPNNPALLAAVALNSNPINATTGPIAAGGKTISIHFVPHFLIIKANKQPQNPTATNPPKA